MHGHFVGPAILHLCSVLRVVLAGWTRRSDTAAQGVFCSAVLQNPPLWYRQLRSAAFSAPVFWSVLRVSWLVSWTERFVGWFRDDLAVHGAICRTVHDTAGTVAIFSCRAGMLGWVVCWVVCLTVRYSGFTERCVIRRHQSRAAERSIGLQGRTEAVSLCYATRPNSILLYPT